LFTQEKEEAKEQPMFDETIIARWVEERSSVALKKLLNNEPLSFEDNMIFALVGQREEMQRVSKRLEERIDGVEKRMERLENEVVLLRKEMIAIRQDINTLTRWILTAIVGLPVVMKLLDLLTARL
jgi:predicted  nucleic acid-binding Zn-ribbon protein